MFSCCKHSLFQYGNNLGVSVQLKCNMLYCTTIFDIYIYKDDIIQHDLTPPPPHHTPKRLKLKLKMFWARGIGIQARHSGDDCMCRYCQRFNCQGWKRKTLIGLQAAPGI